MLELLKLRLKFSWFKNLNAVLMVYGILTVANVSFNKIILSILAALATIFFKNQDKIFYWILSFVKICLSIALSIIK